MTTFSARWSHGLSNATHNHNARRQDAAPIGPVDYNYTTDTNWLLIGEGGAD